MEKYLSQERIFLYCIQYTVYLILIMITENLTNKFVAVLNEKIPVGSLMNALAHMTAGLVGAYPNVADMRFDSYFDKDGGDHKSISDHPFIILKAENSNQIRTLRQQLLNHNSNLPFITSTHVRENDEYIHFVDFTDTMTVGTYVEQKERTKQTSEADLQYYGICMFGDKITLSQLTKKFSLWR